MTLSEKQKLASVARTLIVLLQLCDDIEFADTVIQSVINGDDSALAVERL